FDQTGLEAGNYTIVVTALDQGDPNNDNGYECSTTVQVVVKDDPYELTISNHNPVNPTDCDPLNGTITITELTYDSDEDLAATITGTGLEDADITYNLYTNATLTTLAAGVTNTITGNNPAFTGLAAGTYYVRATFDNTGTIAPGCSSPAVKFVLTNDATNPPITLTSTPNTYCSTATFDGTVSISQYNGLTVGNADAIAGTDFSTTWYKGTIGNKTTQVGTSNATTVTGLEEGDYWVALTDINGTPNNGCSTVASVEVSFDPVTLSFSTNNVTSSITKSDNTSCSSDNGSFAVQEVSFTRLGVTDVNNTDSDLNADFTFKYYNSNFGSATTFTAGTEPSNLAAGTYYIEATHSTSTCVTSLYQIEIKDDITEITRDQLTVTNDANCSTAGNGTISVSFTTGGNNGLSGGGYNYTWYNGTSNTGTPRTDQSLGTGTNADPFILNNLSAGNYTIEVSDKNNGCTLVKTYEIVEELYYPTLTLQASQVVANTTCASTGNGTITINDADITYSAGSSSISNYTWTITAENGSSISGNTSPYTFPGTGSTFTLTGLSADTYSIVARHNTTTCANGGFKIEILDESVNPVIDDFTVVSNDNCNGSVAAGSIELLSIDGATPSATYNYQWYIGEDTTGGNEVSTTYPSVVDTNEIIQGVTDGNYTVKVINTTTFCRSTQTINITNEPTDPFITSSEVNKNLSCLTTGNGSFVILQGKYGDTILDSTALANDYKAMWYAADGSTPITDLDASTPFKLDSLSAGTYHASIKKVDSNCESDLVQFVIQDNLLYPEILISQLIADSTCATTATTPTGSLLAIADEVQIDSLYSFSWYQVDPSGNRTGSAISNNDTLSGLFAGRYEVEVTYLSVGCISTGQFTLTNDPAQLRIMAVDSASQTTCSPSDGFYEVTRVNYGQLSDYTFDFYNEDPTLTGATPILSGPSPILNSANGFDVVADTYYVIGYHAGLACSTDIYQIELTDETPNVNINLEFFTKMTNCDPSRGNGSLTVSANGSTDTTAYTFQWVDELGTVIEDNNFYLKSLPIGTYTVNITDLTTGCIYSESYTMSQENSISPINLSLSTSANTNCINPNGVVAGTVLNIPDIPDNPFIDNDEEERRRSFEDYKFYWFIGDLTAGMTIADTVNADYTGSLVENLLNGQYTVFVVDQIDPMCSSIPTLVTVRDETATPEIAIRVINDRTICYDGMPDGRATVSIPDSTMTFRYEFEWIIGTDTSSAPFATGVSVDSLDIATYSVKIRDKVTGCKNFTTFDIIDGSEAIEQPAVNLVSDRTNCTVPNGHAIVSVLGETEGYLFEWYDTRDPQNVAFTGSAVTTLDSVDYVVQATLLATGCKSNPSPVSVGYEVTDPVFEVFTENSICLRTEDGSTNQFNGYADLRFEANPGIDSIVWTDPFGGMQTSSFYEPLGDAAPGLWNVWFRAENGCDYTADFEIETSLKIYNGVSANGDGANDFFLIDCIDLFPNNNVKIYNRDGLRVYEADQYNNFETRFDGTSNVGSAKLLPGGTYFYIIDRGDGSDLVQGYVELVR
ncbi:MAG: gliding motility-associated C-terminal domain-containing protein, partial [Cyclobacteriaceae bacterium]